MRGGFGGKLCVVTGGSSGIGYSIAEQLAVQGARLLLVARDQTALEQAAAALRARGAAQVAVLAADVTQEADRARLAPAVAEIGEAADLVVTSAGIVSAGLLEETPLAEWQRLHTLNVLGLVGVLQALLPAMRARAEAGGGGGHILNIASAAGLVGFPGMSAYGATKAAVVAFSESLRAELSGLGIGVTAVCPGFVQTPIADKLALFGRMDSPRTRKGIAQWFARNRLTPETVARRALAAAAADRPLLVVGRDARAGYLSKRWAPALFRRSLARAGAAANR